MINISIYIVISILPLLLAGITQMDFKTGRNRYISGNLVYVFIIAAVFTVVMGCRGIDVGVDTSPYTRIYKIIGSNSSLFGALKKAPLSAPVYIFLDFILYRISSDPRLMIAVTSAIVNIGVFRYIYKSSESVWTSTCCYIGLTLFYCSMNGNRQCIAMACVLLGLLHLKDKAADVKGWVYIAIAVGIHETALFASIILAGMFIAKRTMNTARVFWGSTIFSIFFNVFFIKLIPVYTNLFPRYEMYVSGKKKYSILQGTGSGRIIILYAFLSAVIVLWVMANYKKAPEKGDINYLILPGIIFGMVFGMFNAKNELANRMIWYFLALFITFIPATLKSYKGYTKYILNIGIISALYLYSFLSLIENQNGVVPYIFLQ